MSSLVINSKIWGEMFGTREMSEDMQFLLRDLMQMKPKELV